MGGISQKQISIVIETPEVAKVNPTQIEIGDRCMEELVSIIIPCYNHEQYIDSCLESLVCQSYRNIELLVCDDCSPDGSYDKLLSWRAALEKRFPYVEIVRNETNQGVCRTLNRLLSMSHGRFIKGLASDDMLLPDAITSFVAFAETHNFDLLFSNALIVDENDQYPIADDASRKSYYEQIPAHGRNLVSKLYLGNFILGASMFFRKETFEKYGHFDESYSYEDWEYCLRVSVEGNIEYMDKATVYYRVLEGSLSHYARNDEGRKRFRKFYAEKKRLFSKYCPCPSKAEVGTFYNQSLRTAFYLEDASLVKEIISAMRIEHISISKDNFVRKIAFKLHLLNLIRSIKRYITSHG